MTSLYFLDVAEFTDVSAVASAQPGATTKSIAGYIIVTAPGELVVDRRETGVRHSVWYSALSAVSGGRVVQYDKNALRVEPTA